MISSHSTLLSLLLVCLSIFPSCDAYWAVMYKTDLRQALKTQFLNRTESPQKSMITTNDRSFLNWQSQSHHTTVAFQPNASVSAYYASQQGKIQTATILAYAHDEFGQAILLKYDGDDAIPSENKFPHTTISSRGTGSSNYAPVYSNDLWARIAAEPNLVKIKYDSRGQPCDITFRRDVPIIKKPKSSAVAQVSLPQFTSSITGTTKTYEPTVAYVEIFSPPIKKLITGIFCDSNNWNQDTGVCTTA